MSVTLEQVIVALAEDKTPEGRAVFLKAVEIYNAQALARVTEIKAALDNDVNTQVALTIREQGEKLGKIEQDLEGALRNVRKANAALRGAQPWWVRWFVCF